MSTYIHIVKSPVAVASYSVLTTQLNSSLSTLLKEQCRLFS